MPRLSRFVFASMLPLALAGVALPAAAQSDVPEWIRSRVPKPDSPVMQRYAQQQKERMKVDKDLRKLRQQYFSGIRKTEIRQEGLVKLREYTNPAYFPLLVEVFKREGADVKTALLDQFTDCACAEGDGSLAWLAIFDTDEQVRTDAVRRIKLRIAANGKVPDTVKLALFEGIRSSDQSVVTVTAGLTNDLNVIDAIPWLISAQVQSAAVNSAGQDRDGALAFIVVGQQTAFVSDLQPVVGPSAVAFDPQLSTITTGTILRVMDASVITYQVDVHNALVDMTSREWGRPTRGLGWNVPAWREWYQRDFMPDYAKKQQALAEAAATTQPAPVNPK